MKFLNSYNTKLFYGIRLILKNPRKLNGFLLKCYRLGICKTIKNYFSNSYTEYENIFDLSCKNFTILTTPHCLIIAEQIKKTLSEFGFCCEITKDEEVLYLKSQSSIPIILAPQMFSKLPKHFVAYQLEQPESPWFNQDYVSLLKRATFILEYSNRNIENLIKYGIDLNKIFYCPIFPNSFSYLSNKESNSTNKEYDLIFYGAINNRRKKILNELSYYYKILILTEVYGEELYRQMKRARILLNIHYYENAELETTRLTEGIAQGIPIVSETSTVEIDKQFEDYVSFAKRDSVEELKKTIDKELSKEKSKSIKTNKGPMDFSWFDFYLLRFILSQDLISLDRFINHFSKTFPKLDSKICISLPEYQDRRTKFLKQPYSDTFYLFPGLRHNLGWIGCCYSYKFLFTMSSRRHSKNLCICEDDVKFPTDISEKLKVIERFLNHNQGKWEMFAGLVSDVPRDTKIIEISKYMGIEFLFFTKTMGLVFCIFSSEALEKLAKWEFSLDVNNNTIDKFMLTKLNKFVTILPFLVKQDETISSTIWNGDNFSLYNAMIEGAEAKLGNILNKYKTNNR